jgi:hypothetical protein
MIHLLCQYLKELKQGKDPSFEKYLKNYPYSKEELRELLQIARSAYRPEVRGKVPEPSSKFSLSLRERLLKILEEQDLEQ